jgi:hypothetical protein
MEVSDKNVERNPTVVAAHNRSPTLSAHRRYHLPGNSSSLGSALSVDLPSTLLLVVEVATVWRCREKRVGSFGSDPKVRGMMRLNRIQQVEERLGHDHEWR